MIKKLIALSIVLLLPVTFISSASAASKSITCYKGTAKKVFKNSTGKCPSGWSSKKPVAPKTPANNSNASYKVQDISSSEVEEITTALWALKNTQSKNIFDTCVSTLIHPYRMKLGSSGASAEAEAIQSLIYSTRMKNPLSGSTEFTPEQYTQIINDLDKQLQIQLQITSKENYDFGITYKNIESECSRKSGELYSMKLKELLPVSGKTEVSKITSKLISNFCGLNRDLLNNNNSLLAKSDPLIGYQRYNEQVMQPFYKNLDLIIFNGKFSVNTPITAEFLAIAQSKQQFYYDGADYYFKNINLYNMLHSSRWKGSLNDSAYGVSVSTPYFVELKTKWHETATFCNKR
jgi:hypothetical protein